MEFTNKTVIITGAANGIGRGIAAAYGEKGANVVIADLDDTVGKAQAEEMITKNQNAIYVKTDVRKETHIKHLMETAAEKFGSIDILINNAGKAKFTPFLDLDADEWDDILSTNLRSVFLCSREAARFLKMNRTGGAIVNMASTRALMSEPDSEAYAASKGGIAALTHALAASLGKHHITVNAILPGWIETGDYSRLRTEDHQQHFSGRVGKPEDIARACLYLTSKENDFVTGAQLVIDGGMTRKMIYEE